MACVCGTLVTRLLFITANHSDYNCLYGGEGARKLKSQFKQARKHKKAIIFIDEVRHHTATKTVCVCTADMLYSVCMCFT
jgi:ATP-dependent 26S proteasome regulatory subunit